MGTLEELRESRDREATERLESKMAKPAGFVGRRLKSNRYFQRSHSSPAGLGLLKANEPH